MLVVVLYMPGSAYSWRASSTLSPSAVTMFQTRHSCCQQSTLGREGAPQEDLLEKEEVVKDKVQLLIVGVELFC